LFIPIYIEKHSCIFEGARTVIHPKARILAEDGPIIIGENNIIEELSQIVNRFVTVYSR